MPYVIGICGYAQVGKTTLAKALQEILPHATFALPFALPVKFIAERIFGWDGQKDERGRRLLQVVGTDAGRAYDPDIWVRIWEKEAVKSLEFGMSVIADDVRFQNEVDAIHRLGGTVIRLISKTRGVRLDHASEQPDDLQVDWNVMGDLPPEEIALRVQELIRRKENAYQEKVQRQETSEVEHAAYPKRFI